MFLPWVLLPLLAAHVLLAWSGGSASPWAQAVAVAVQAVAVAALVARRRRSAPGSRPMWRLLAIAVALQMSWGVCNVLAGLLGPSGQWLSTLAVVLSGLYMIPCMFLIARSFDRSEPRAVLVLDLLLSVLVAALLYLLVTRAISGDVPGGVMLVIAHADAIDFSLAALATVRLLGTRGASRRAFYATASAFLWLNAIGAALFNRMELGGLPWWAGPMLDVAFVAVAWMALRPPPRWVMRYRPSRQRVQLVGSFAPIVLSLGVLLLAVSVSRLSFEPGVLAASASVIFYGLRVALLQSRDQTLQRQAQLRNQHLQQQLGRDPLTGIANRATLDAHLQRMLDPARAEGVPCSLLMIDIDFFKQYNDSQGHLLGDDCLVQVARAFAGALQRTEDLVARYGGEEFAVVLPETSSEGALAMAERLLDAVAALWMPHPLSPVGRITVSIGVATRVANVTDTPLELLRAADRALYEAKRGGRNRIAVAGDSSPAASP